MQRLRPLTDGLIWPDRAAGIDLLTDRI